MLAADGTADRAEQLIAVTERLTVLIEAEIVALKARRLNGASADWDEKERLAHAYRLEVAHIKNNPAALAGLDADRKEQLRQATRKFENAVEIHAAALTAMKQVSEGLVRAIAGEVAASRAAPPAYGRSGVISEGAKPDSSGLAVNARV